MTLDPSAAARPDSRAARRRSSSRGGWAFLRDVLVIIVIAIVVSALVKAFLIRSFYIPSGSMEDTLQISDRIVVDELTPRFTGYDRGDIVVFRDPGGWLDPALTASSAPLSDGIDWLLSLVGFSVSDSSEHLIKRVIGVPGDHVVCCNAIGQITVNGVPIDESAYVKLAPGKTAPDEYAFDVTVPAESLWVMGDNRDRSRDSRYNQDQPTHGFVPFDDVVGRAFVITWPFDRFGLLDSHSEVFAGVPDSASTP